MVETCYIIHTFETFINIFGESFMRGWEYDNTVSNKSFKMRYIFANVKIEAIEIAVHLQ